MIYPKIPLAQSIITLFKTKGIKNIIISPGSRNAPLTIGFTADDYFNCFSIPDERVAAFFALGIAQQLKEPTAVVCTSGSALLNYYPAFAEAFYNQIPFIVVSADRPLDKIDIGDGQTIRQQNVFANHSIFNANLTENASVENDELINKAINESIINKGPVHINAPFEEPLYETTNELSVTPQIHPIINQGSEQIQLDDEIEYWNSSKKKLVLIGGLDPKVISSEIINFLGNDNSVLVMTEVTSNVHHPNFITNIDTIITPFNEDDFIKFQPDLLITFGGMIVSKRIKSALRNYKPKKHWHIDKLRAYDTFNSLTSHFKVEVDDFFNHLITFSKTIDSDYQKSLLSIKEVRKVKHQMYLKSIPFCDLKLFELVLSKIPNHFSLQISNSSPIRYAQLFEINPEIEVFCNRGTSGIDGSTSTAIGAANTNLNPTLFITGDISFFYDSNALWNNYIPKNFKIILINNGGGGIFRILPGHSENEVFNTFFETSHCHTAKHLARMYGFDYLTASDEIGLNNNIDVLFNQNKPTILEVFTPTKHNDTYLLNYFKM